MTANRALGAGLLVVAAMVWPWPAAGVGAQGRAGPTDAGIVQEIETQVEAVRGVQRRGEPELRVLTDEELASLLSGVDNDNDQRRVEARTDLLVLLGFIKPWQRPRPPASGEAIAIPTGILGMYDPRERTIYVVRDPPLDDDVFGQVPSDILERWANQRQALDLMVYAHEFTHALQDQQHDLTHLLDGAPDSDHAMAVRAVVEGDATATSERWAKTYLDDATDALLPIGQAEVLADQIGVLPYARRDQVQFLYGDGARLVRLAFERGGNAAVEQLYADPPASTEQVLHPQKYWAHEQPRDIPLARLTARLGPGWREKLDDTLGELGLDLLLQVGGVPATADAAAAGWGGDHFVVLDHDGAPALAMRSTWDSELDAREFFDSFTSALRMRYADATPVVVSPGRQALESSSTMTVTDVRRQGADVLVTIASDRGSVEALMNAMVSP